MTDKASASTRTRASIRRHLLLGGTFTFLLCGIVGGWATTTELSGAVIASGVLAVDSQVKRVQHPEGGVVREIPVAEGARVEAGAVVLRLDATQATANRQILAKQIDELLARQARGEAEQDFKPDIAFPPELASRAGEPDVADAMNGEIMMFEVRRAARDGRKSQLREQIAETRQAIAGLEEQTAAADEQIALLDEELKGVESLLRRGLATTNRAATMKRERAALQGQRGQYAAAIAEARGRIASAELEIVQVDHAMREEVSKELGDTRARLAELSERRTAAEDQLARAEIRAPQGGIVHKLTVHTVGGVVRPGETVMEIVPVDDVLTVESKVAPRDINEVHAGQPAQLRFSGANARTTPEIGGTVTLVSPDITTDERSGQSFYSVRIAIARDQLALLGDFRPMPGMPVESFIRTHDRTVLSYFVQPLSDQVARAFREK